MSGTQVTTKKIRVLVGEDHNLVREGFLLILGREPDIEIVGDAPSGDEAFAKILGARPDVAVLDVGMPGITGIEVTRKVADVGLRTAIVLVSMHDERSVVESALEAGASGYVLKEGAAHELIDAVHAAASGNTYLSPRVASLVVDWLRAGERKAEVELTPREREVLRLLATGLTSKEIGVQLKITAKTVEGHRAAIMNKLGIRHVPGLVKYAILHHIAPLEQ
jgi:DNA-binding NarL/FixJ family response regulator